MQTKSKKFTPKLKFYHIVLISIILCPFLILNSNSVNKKREEAKLEKEKILSLRKFYARKLDAGDEKFKADTNKVCEKASKELRDYYEGKGDLNSLGINENKNVKREEEGKYIDGLINVVSDEGEGDLMDYIMHLIPILSLLGIGVLFLPGWLVCCICSCADCCCCCCCKKASCKLPFYIITSIFYAFGLCVSIYGLSQSTAVFEGLGDTECSLLKFINDVLYGEDKESTPKWAGIEGIKDLLSRTSQVLATITSSSDITTSQNNIKTAKDNFEKAFASLSQNIYDDTTDYKKSLTIDSRSDDYYLDIVKEFGKLTRDSGSGTVNIPYQNSFAYKWNIEYNAIAEESNSQMTKAIQNFNGLIGNNDITSQINNGVQSIDDLKDSFDKVRDQISGVIIDYSDTIDEYGNIGYKTVFAVFMVIDALIAAFISLRMFCNFPVCQNGCLKCLLKSAIHILWNILALMTFLSLILGSVLSLVGTVGKDLISVVSFLVSDDNLLNEEGTVNENAILLGESAKYLTECINSDRDGDLKSALGFNNDGFDNIEELKSAETLIQSLIDQSNQLKENKVSFKNYKEQYEKRKDYTIDNFELVTVDNQNNKVKSLIFKDYVNKVNTLLVNKHDTWSISCDESSGIKLNCDTDTQTDVQENCIEFNTCKAKDIGDWYSTLASDENVKALKAFIKSIQKASEKATDIETLKTTNPTSFSTKSIDDALTILDYKYGVYIDSQITNLGILKGKINGLTDIIRDYTGDEDFFSIVNCKFIGKNIRIILKSLEKSLGTNIYNIGITLTTTGFAMCFSISFTILLNIILNAKNSGDQIPEIKVMDQNINYPNQYNLNNPNGFNTNQNVNEGLRTIEYNNGM